MEAGLALMVAVGGLPVETTTVMLSLACTPAVGRSGEGRGIRKVVDTSATRWQMVACDQVQDHIVGRVESQVRVTLSLGRTQVLEAVRVTVGGGTMPETAKSSPV